MSEDETFPSFILDRTGDTTATRILEEEVAEEDKESSDEETFVSKRQIKRAKREERAKKLETLLFGEDLKSRFESTVQSDDEDNEKQETRKAAWVDEDDEVLYVAVPVAQSI